MRWLMVSACILAMSGIGGCIPFEGKFAAAARDAVDPNEPLSGGWAGAWVCDAAPQIHPARAVVDAVGPNTCDVWIEMSGFRNVFATWIYAADVPIERQPGGTEHFHAKVPIESRPKQDVWAVAIELEGTWHGSALSIRFRTNDAMRQLDSGQIRLSRKTAG